MATFDPVQTQLLHVSSAGRTSGTIGDFYIDVPHGLVRAAATGRVRVSVVSCSVSRSWYSITPQNNVLTVTSSSGLSPPLGGGGSAVTSGTSATSVTFQPGYYTVLTLRAAAAALLPGWAVTYDRVSNTYAFRPPNDGATHTLAAAGALRLALGLGPSGSGGGTFAAPIRSALPSRVSAETSLLVRSSLPLRKGSVVDNYAGGEMRESDVLLEMPINAPPFDTLSYQNGGGEPQHSFELATTHLQDLRLWLTDERGAPIEPAFDWSLVLKVTMGAAGSVHDVIARKLDDLLVYVKYAVWSLFPPGNT